MKRPNLNKADLNKVMTSLVTGRCKAGIFITMSPGQWDGLLHAAYDRRWNMLELNEMPVRAYRKKMDVMR